MSRSGALAQNAVALTAQPKAQLTSVPGRRCNSFLATSLPVRENLVCSLARLHRIWLTFSGFTWTPPIRFWTTLRVQRGADLGTRAVMACHSTA